MRLEKKTQIKKIREKWGRRREILVCVLKKKSSRVCGFPPTLSASLTSTAQAVLILQTQELIFSFLSIFVLLDIYLPLACILLLILNWPSWPSISTHFLSLPDLKNASTPTSPDRMFKIPLSPGIYNTTKIFVLSLPISPQHRSSVIPSPYLVLEQSPAQGRDSCIWTRNCLKYCLKNCLKCYYKKQTWDAREGVESPNILWILRVCEIRKEGGRKDRRRKKKRKEIQKNENAGKEERERSGLLKFNSLPQWQFAEEPNCSSLSTSQSPPLLITLTPVSLSSLPPGHFWSRLA